MTKLAGKIVVAVLVNALGLWAAAKYIPGFSVGGGYEGLFVLAAILTVLNFTLKPVLKLLFGPIIILTLGLGLVVVNALVLYALDRFSTNLTIDTIPALVYGSLVIGAVNFIFHLIP